MFSVLTDAPPRRLFYGWRIVAFAAVGLAMTAPGQTIGVSVFVDPMIEALDVTRSQFSGAYLMGTLSGAAAMPYVGRLIDRHGVRWMMFWVGVAFATMLVGMSAVAGLATLTLGFAGIRMLGQGSLTLVSTTSVAMWFERRRGTAVGVMSMGGSGGISVAPLLLTAAITWIGWRGAWIVAAVIVATVLIPVALMGMRDHPGDVGQRVDGDRNGPDTETYEQPSWTRAEAMRTLMFWAIAGAVAANALILTALAFHQISILGERGLTPVEAAANFLPQTAASVTATLGMGALVDRLRPKPLLLGSMALLASALLLVQSAAPGARAIAFAVAAGAAMGSMRSLEAAAVPRLYGLRHIGSIRGSVMSVVVASSALGPFILALGFERFSSYGPVLTALLAVPLLLAVLALVARPPDSDLLLSRRAAAVAQPDQGAPLV